MHVCTVVGTVWATQKERTLTGLRLLVVRPFTTCDEPSAETMVAVDTVSAGVGERVLVVHGRAARHAIGKGHDVGFQTAIVGVVDSMELEGGRLVGQTAEMDRPAASGARERGAAIENTGPGPQAGPA